MNETTIKNINKTIHERTRLSIIAALFTSQEGLSFNSIKKSCSLTDGNLSRHLQILKSKEFITIEKSFKNNKPYTFCTITATGSYSFIKYVENLESIIKDLKNEKTAGLFKKNNLPQEI